MMPRVEVEPSPVRPIEYDADSAAMHHVAVRLARVLGVLGLIFGCIGLVLSPLVLMSYSTYFRVAGPTSTDAYRFLVIGGTIVAIGLDALLVAGSVMCLRLRPPGGRRALLAYAWGHFAYALFGFTANLWWTFTYYGRQRMLSGGVAYLVSLIGTEFAQSARGVGFAVVVVVLLRRPEVAAVFRQPGMTAETEGNAAQRL